jgi:hypothetical protein
MVSELFHADGRTDRHDEVKSRFSQFCELVYKRIVLNCSVPATHRMKTEPLILVFALYLVNADRNELR